MRDAGSGAPWDAIVIGGGFYGCEVALELRRVGLARVLLVEREAAIMRRASFVNQARVHHGYHYPRSIPTAARSRDNFDRFTEAYRFAIVGDFTNIYAIARNSRVMASQFEAFCRRVDLPCRPAPDAVMALFDRTLIEAAYTTQEYAFDAEAIARHLHRALLLAGVEVRLGAPARLTTALPVPRLIVGDEEILQTSWVFNCTYSGVEAAGIQLRAQVKKELAEMLLIQPPRELVDKGITVMDGPYFSTMPHPALGGHTLSHVRYTPHSATGPGLPAPSEPLRSNEESILRDAARYLPCLRRAKVTGHLLEIKAILTNNEQNDGRPILFEYSEANPRIVSILGGKIDNIFDVKLALGDLEFRQ